MDVCPWYRMKVAPSVVQRNISFPLGSEPALLFILSPNGTDVSRLIPRYKLLKALAVPLQL